MNNMSERGLRAPLPVLPPSAMAPSCCSPARLSSHCPSLPPAPAWDTLLAGQVGDMQFYPCHQTCLPFSSSYLVQAGSLGGGKAVFGLAERGGTLLGGGAWNLGGWCFQTSLSDDMYVHEILCRQHEGTELKLNVYQSHYDNFHWRSAQDKQTLGWVCWRG